MQQTPLRRRSCNSQKIHIPHKTANKKNDNSVASLQFQWLWAAHCVCVCFSIGIHQNSGAKVTIFFFSQTKFWKEYQQNLIDYPNTQYIIVTVSHKSNSSGYIVMDSSVNQSLFFSILFLLNDGLSTFNLFLEN